MQQLLRHAVSLVLLGTASTTAMAQDATDSCKAYLNDQWQTLGEGPLTSCLQAVDRWVPDFNNQGFKFGLWGASLLSVDAHYFYSSQDQGSSWAPLGLKADIVAAAQGPELPGPNAAPVIAAIAAEASSGAAAYGAAAANAASQAAVSAAPSADEAGTAPAVISATPSRSATVETRRACSIQVNGNWTTAATPTIEQCAAKLAASAGDYDHNGFKYGYWSGIFLAADKKAVYKSESSGNWEPVLQR